MLITVKHTVPYSNILQDSTLKSEI